MTNDIDLNNLPFKKLESTRPEEAKATSVMTMEAEVDVKPQPLRSLRPFMTAVREIPSSLKPEAQIVLQALFACFERQKEVKEGIVDDLIWGFEQVGFAKQLSAAGLILLEKAGYIKFQAPDNTFIGPEADGVDQAWVRYQPKLLDLVYERSASE